MKRLLIVLALFIGLGSCNSNSSESNGVTSDTTGEAGRTNAMAIDTTQHPDGMINGSVISTDTAAMNVQNSIDKANAAKKNK